ncbi:hypothetical protein GEMMAAP_06920 [Gemmatimonas phototrophica]|uniref:SsuA/THI5-like domain-containing protein n=1 Tax=Gemmatimonas phototrophica TaxID=1379270 RepID=A0A143BHY0_9BACT|nr:hypothetical protein GEMMAAP_06920 [Gemmatimonas phototrophica]
MAHELWGGFYPLDIATLEQSSTLELAVVVEEDSDLLFARFAAGAHDAIAASLVDLLRLQQSVQSLRIVGCTDESRGADAVVARSTVGSISELRGRRIGVRPGTFSELLVSRMLATANLSTSDVQLVSVAARNVPEALRNGTVDAAETWEPYLSSVRDPAFRSLFSTAETPGLVIQCVAVRDQVLRTKPGAVREMIARVIAVGTSVMQTPDSVVPRAARALKRDVLSMPPVRGFRWLSLEDNRQLLGANGQPRLLQAATEHVRFLADIGVLRAPLDLPSLITAEFLPQ